MNIFNLSAKLLDLSHIKLLQSIVRDLDFRLVLNLSFDILFAFMQVSYKTLIFYKKLNISNNSRNCTLYHLALFIEDLYLECSINIETIIEIHTPYIFCCTPLFIYHRPIYKTTEIYRFFMRNIDFKFFLCY